MLSYTTVILKFGAMGEKSGWSYIIVPAHLAQRLKPGNKKSFRVKGKLDEFPISGVALLPIGKGEFIMPLNATMRKGIGKSRGAMLQVTLAADNTKQKLDAELIACLKEDAVAASFFKSLSPSHQRYFSKWISDARTDATKTKRIAHCLNVLSLRQDFGYMLRSIKKTK